MLGVPTNIKKKPGMPPAIKFKRTRKVNPLEFMNMSFVEYIERKVSKNQLDEPIASLIKMMFIDRNLKKHGSK